MQGIVISDHLSVFCVLTAKTLLKEHKLIRTNVLFLVLVDNQYNMKYIVYFSNILVIEYWRQSYHHEQYIPDNGKYNIFFRETCRAEMWQYG